MNPQLAAVIRRLIARLGYRIERYDEELPEIWSSDEEFARLHREMDTRTLVTPDRCFFIYQLARATQLLPGDQAEVGVYRGGTARLLARTVPERTTHLFDTFGGMPGQIAEIDLHRAGDFADTSLSAVQEFLSDCENVRFYPGVFPETAADVLDTRFAFVHIDVDIYGSVTDALELFYSRVVPGGVIVLDDYEWKHCPGVKQAVTEFLADKPEQLIVTSRYQCAIVRLP